MHEHLIRLSPPSKASTGLLLVFLLALGVLLTGASWQGSNVALWEGLGTGVSDEKYVLQGQYTCKLYGTFDGATVTVQAIVPDGTQTIKNVEVPELTGATAETPWTLMVGGGFTFQVNVVGGTAPSVNFVCGRYA